MQKNKTIVNVICSVLVLVTNIVISFWLSPFIIKNIGVEANGFISLANNFTSYANLMVAALNSMAARFITIAYVQGDYKKANLYYNSVFWGNWIIVGVLLIPAFYLIMKLESFVNVPADILFDVKLLFAFVFANFFIQTGLPNWDCGTYVSNRLDRAYVPSMVFGVLRAVILVLILTLFTPKVWYIGFVNIVIMMAGCVVGWYNTKKLTPHLHVFLNPKKAVCSFRAIQDLVGSGIWDSISSVGIMLLNGLDLIICNLFIGATEMGILSLSKTLPNLLQQLSASICNAFGPELVINYAAEDKDKLLRGIKRSMKITSIFLTVPLVGVVVMSVDFYKLWVPSQNATLLATLTIVTCAGRAFTSGIQILFKVFSTVNKVKLNATLTMLSGAVSTIVVFILLKKTNLGVYAIAGVSVLVNLVRNMVYTVPFAAKYLGMKKTQFFPQVFTCITSTLLLTAVGFFIKGFFTIDSWTDFFGVAILMGTLFFAISIFVFLKKADRTILFEKIKGKVKRRV